MSEKKVYRGEVSEDDAERREIFLATYCKDATESFKQLFTLNSALLVFFGTFAKDKFFESNLGSNLELKAQLVYAALTSSLILCIFGLYLLQVAAEKATNINLWGYWLPWVERSEYSQCALVANWLLEGAGGTFIITVLLIGSVIF